MEEDDIDDDDQPRVVYADAEREGRMARYAAGVGEGADVSASRGSHGASEGAFAPRGPAPGAAPWASDDDVDGAPPPTLLEEEDERARSPARGDGRASAAGARSDATMANARRGSDRGDRTPFSPASGSGSDDEDVVDASPGEPSGAKRARKSGSSARRQPSGDPHPRGEDLNRDGGADEDADRAFLEETLGNAAAAARVASAARGDADASASARVSKKAKTTLPRRSPRGKAKAKASAPRNKNADGANRGLASLASLGALARGEAAPPLVPPAKDASANVFRERGVAKARGADRKAPEPRTLRGWTLAAARAARLDDDDDDDDDDIDDDDGADDDGEDAALNARGGVSKDADVAEDAVPCTEGEDDRPPGGGGGSERPPPPTNRGGLMSALARLPSRAPGTAADDALARLGGAGPSQRGGARGAHRHGSNAPTARLQRIMHRVRARQAQFLSTDVAVDASASKEKSDKSSAAELLRARRCATWGRPMIVTLVGECGAEAGLCLWECVGEDDELSPSVDRGGFGGFEDAESEKREELSSERDWLRRGADAPAPGAVLAMDGRVARELSLRGGSRVSVFPPWNEVEVPPSVATGFKRRRVVIGALVAV
jgi:hypothetical protein